MTQQQMIVIQLKRASTARKLLRAPQSFMGQYELLRKRNSRLEAAKAAFRLTLLLFKRHRVSQ